MATQAEKINKLDKEIALIQKDIYVIKNNHLKHIENDIKNIKLVGYTVAIGVFSQLFMLVKELLL
jgi:50S ribosomal subunit-associated GTPase HflX